MGGNKGRETWETHTSFVQTNDGKTDLEANETNSWERDHSCDTVSSPRNYSVVMAEYAW